MQDKAIPARNTDRALIEENTSLGSDFGSNVIDFKEMTLGSIQAIFSNNDALDGEFRLWVSNEYCNQGDVSIFAPYPGSEIELESGCKSLAWKLDRIAFRFYQIRYEANSVTQGEVTIIARGKKG